MQVIKNIVDSDEDFILCLKLEEALPVISKDKFIRVNNRIKIYLKECSTISAHKYIDIINQMK